MSDNQNSATPSAAGDPPPATPASADPGAVAGPDVAGVDAVPVPDASPASDAGEEPVAVWAEQASEEFSGQAPPAVEEAPPLQLMPAVQPDPPRALTPGAFLHCAYEVQEVWVRGVTNLYLAVTGDYGASRQVLLAERLKLPQPTDSRPQPSSPLFPPTEHFVGEDREYLVFENVAATALQDHREPPNDERYLTMLDGLSSGLLELEQGGWWADCNLELLRLGGDGNLAFYGFVDPAPAAPDPALADQLRELNRFLLVKVFAQATTMVLGDEFGGLCFSEEVKTLARALHAEPPPELSAACALLAPLWPEVHGAVASPMLLSDVGQVRELNEDAGMILTVDRLSHLSPVQADLWVVADGMGGHEGGEVASHLTLVELQCALARLSEVDWDNNLEVRSALLQVMDEVNQAVVRLTQEERYRRSRAKPGSTLVFAWRLGARVWICNVGDSRAYKYSPAAGLQQITRDHSYVQDLIDRGELSPQEAWGHPDGSIITANIGDPKLRHRDVFLRLLGPGDKLLLVSDGVVDMLRDEEIAPLVQAVSPAEVCGALVQAANEAGGYDNITALCVTFTPGDHVHGH